MTADPLASLERRTLSTSVYARVKQAITSGELPPGTRLTEKYLTERLEVGRSTVREAISRLVHEGYLIGRPYEGYRVNRPTLHDVRDVYEVLICLTQTVMHLALDRADEQQVADLVSFVDQADEALARGDVEAYFYATRELRLRAAEYSQNKHLQNLFEQHIYHPAVLRPWGVDDLEGLRSRAIDYSALREAITSRDGLRAGELVTDGTRRNLQYVLAELGGSSPIEGRLSPPGREPAWLVEGGGPGVGTRKEVAVGQ